MPRLEPTPQARPLAPVARRPYLSGTKATRERRFDHDLLVLGSGPAGQRAAIEAARQGLSVGVVEKQSSVGGGVIAVEYASVFALLGIEVHLLNRGKRLLGFLDPDVVAALKRDLAGRGVVVHHRATAAGYECGGRGGPVVTLASGDRLEADLVMVAAGRTGTAPELELERAGLVPTERGLVEVDERFRTAVPHILAAGDMVGYPSLASASRVQGLRAVRYLLGLPVESDERLPLPFGIYTVPEIAYVGATEAELVERGRRYVVGRANLAEVARGEILGDETGLMKLLFAEDDRSLLGVHVIGTDATEIVHLGQAAMALGGTLDYFVASVLNYPTLSECYKVAALAAEARLCGERERSCRT